MYKSFLFLIAISVCLYLIACGGTRHWVQVEGDEPYESASDFCDAVARGNAPMPAPGAAPKYSMQGSGFVGTTPFSYSGTMQQNNLSHSLNQFGAALGAMAAQNNIFEACMKRMGWYPTDNPEEIYKSAAMDRSAYMMCVDMHTWQQSANYSSAQSLAAQIEKMCKERIGTVVPNYAIYKAAQFFENTDSKKGN